MRIFLTGATGYIGSAVLDTLVRGGHQVTALVRDAGKGRRLQKLGAKGVVGDLANGTSWTAAAVGHDAFIHTAFEATARRVDADRVAIETLAAAAYRLSRLAVRASPGLGGRDPPDQVEDRPP